MKRMKPLVTGLILFVLLTLSNACCAEKTPPPIISPPVIYLQKIPEPLLRGRTNGDLVEWALELHEALRLANSDKEALKQWANEVK